MNIVIIGCGLIGRKRAMSLNKEDNLLACCDVDFNTAQKFGDKFKCNIFTDYKELLSKIECDIVIVAVVNKFIKEIVIAALKLGKHVLVEKPLGRNYVEAEEMYLQYKNISVSKHIVFKTGFNHRFHPAILKAKQIIDEGKIGQIFSIRALYGHGGRPGMENEWRSSKDLCGGGELLDQGVHIVDLIRWFGGEITEVFGSVETKFWELEVEDNAYAILKTDRNVTAVFNVSWTNWRNAFSFEVFGTSGYLKINGLGSSYGNETLEYGIRRLEGGKPDIKLFEFAEEDSSWREEWNEFKSAIIEKRNVIGNSYDGFRANKVVDAIYLSNMQKKAITVL
jgi:predicted dehydrogenase